MKIFSKILLKKAEENYAIEKIEGKNFAFLNRVIAHKHEIYATFKGHFKIQDYFFSYEHFPENKIFLLVATEKIENIENYFNIFSDLKNEKKQVLGQEKKFKKYKKFSLFYFLILIMRFFMQIFMRIKNYFFPNKNFLRDQLLKKNLSIDLIEFLLANKQNIKKIFKEPNEPLLQSIDKKIDPYVILMIGTNGVGKSSTISKLAYYLMNRGKSVSIIAGDTFRSGAIEQLEIYCRKLQNFGPIRFHSENYGTDETAIISHSIKNYAKLDWKIDSFKNFLRKSTDIILIDSAGRMPSNTALANSLQKILGRTQIDSLLLVTEAVSAQFENMKLFDKICEEIRPIDGMIFTKLDVADEAVGLVFEGAYRMRKPIYFICDGQRNVDLREFDKNEFFSKISLFSYFH